MTIYLANSTKTRRTPTIVIKAFKEELVKESGGVLPQDLPEAKTLSAKFSAIKTSLKKRGGARGGAQ